MAQLVAMAVARVLSRLTGNSPRTLAMASSQLLAAPQEGKEWVWRGRKRSGCGESVRNDNVISSGSNYQG